MTRIRLGLGLAVVAGGALVILAGLNAASVPGRRQIGGPVPGMVAVINASSPSDDIFNGQFCGGVVVGDREVLTAAHCVDQRDASAIEVVIQADNLCRTAPVDGERIALSAIKLHPRYDGASARYDLALLTLRTDISPTLIKALAPLRDPAEAVVLGWGRPSPGGLPPCRLMLSEQRTLSSDACPALVDDEDRHFDPASMLCAVPSARGSSDSCAGDSGGPLIMGNDPKGATVVGIVSWGRGCGAETTGVYARVDTWPSDLSVDDSP